MLLSKALSDDEGAVRADLQRYYGIDLDEAMRGAHSAGHVAALIAHLPSDASIYRSRDNDASWTLEASLMACIFNLLSSMIYGMSDKKSRGNKPAHIGPSWMNKQETAPARLLTVDELMAELSLPRRNTWQ